MGSRSGLMARLRTSRIESVPMTLWMLSRLATSAARVLVPTPVAPPMSTTIGSVGLPQDAPLVEPAHDDGVLLDELVADPGKDLLLLDRVELLGQQLGANLASYLVRQLRTWRPPALASAPGCRARTASPDPP